MIAGFGFRVVVSVVTAFALIGSIAPAALPPNAEPLAPPPSPVPFATYTAFPSTDPDDGKFLAVAGNDLQTLGGISVIFYVGLAAGTTTFEVGIFDGDTGANWDSRGDNPVLLYRVYRDPLKTGSSSGFVTQWSSEELANNDWTTKTLSTEPSARAPSGNYFYRVDANWETPSDRSFNNFKIRTTGQLSLRAGQDFGFAGGPQRIPSDPSDCPDSGEPSLDPPVTRGDPNPGETNDFNANSYNGDWTWFFYVPTVLASIAFRDGDSDRADDENAPGAPADDGTLYGTCAHVTPSIFYTVTDPESHVFTNNNPSGNREWEDFTIGPNPGDDVVINYALQPGLWKLRVEGMDAHNFNVMRTNFEVYSTTDPPLPVNPTPEVQPDHELTTKDGVTVEYGHNVTNKGANDSFDLRAASGHGWATRIYHDANGNGQRDAGEAQVTMTPSLGTNQSYPIVVQIDVPPGSNNVDDLAIVRASSRTEWAVQDEAEDTTHVRVNQRPNADAGGPYLGFEGLPITFDASLSFDPEATPLTYLWDWNGDGAFDETTSSPIVDHTFGDDLSNHLVVLEVSDGNLTDNATATVSVQNLAPVVALEAVPSGDEASSLEFRARLTDPGSDDLTVEWSGHCEGWTPAAILYNDPTVGADPDPSPDVHPRDEVVAQTVVCGDDATFTFNLRVQDDDGGETTVTSTFDVSNLPPGLAVSPPQLVAVDEGLQVTLAATAADAGSDDLTFTWSWTFGPTESRTVFNDGAGPDPDGSWWGTYPFAASDSSTHTYGDDCRCLVTLRVDDDDGGFVLYTTTVEVRNVAPAIDGEITAIVTADLTLRVAGEKFHDVTLTIFNGVTSVAATSVVRMPGSPDDQSATIHDARLDMFSGAMSAMIVYTPLDDPINGQVWGADPAWVTLRGRDGQEVRLHHTFNVRHSDTWVWIIADFRPLLVGFPIDFAVPIADPGSDDVKATILFGDGEGFTELVFNDGAGPDLFPSPDVRPVAAVVRAVHAYAEGRLYTVVFTVIDDDGGIVEVTRTIDLSP